MLLLLAALALAQEDPLDAAVKRVAEAVAEPDRLDGLLDEAARLGEKPEPLASLNADTPLAIGSTFKLYLLGALLAGKRPWNETVSDVPQGRRGMAQAHPGRR
jgi:beta-lactamase class A